MATLNAQSPTGTENVRLQMSSSAPRVSCTASQFGSQSPGLVGSSPGLSGQPSSDPCRPGTDTAFGCGTALTGAVTSGALPTTPHDDATPRSPSWSRTTTRYSISEP